MTPEDEQELRRRRHSPKLTRAQKNVVLRCLAAGDTNRAVNDALFVAGAQPLAASTLSSYRRAVNYHAIKADAQLEAVQVGFADRVKRIQELNESIEDTVLRLKGKVKGYDDITSPPNAGTFVMLVSALMAQYNQMDKLVGPLEAAEAERVRQAEAKIRHRIEVQQGQSQGNGINMARMLADYLERFMAENGLLSPEEVADAQQRGLLGVSAGDETDEEDEAGLEESSAQISS